MSESEIQNVKFQLASLKRKRDSVLVGGEVRETTQEQSVTVKPRPPTTATITVETAKECATRLRRTVQSGEYREQYKKLQAVKPRSGHTHASLACNAGKNRYRNVPAPDHSRVKLVNSDPQVEGGDYINASHIDFPSLHNGYIVTQGPLPSTVVDFWRLVWQQGVMRIVMTCNVVEDGRVKSERYWPEVGKSVTYGSITVRGLSLQRHKGHVERRLRVTSDGISRQVTHYHFTGWPDFGTPCTPAGFVELVKSVGGVRGGEGGRILVHCSAGLGRSGVFVAVHSSLESQAEGAGRVDLETTVREMRKHRGGMVQTSEQYSFCFEATAEALDPTLPPTEEEEFRPPEGTQFSNPPPPSSDAPPLPPRPSSQHPHQQQESRVVKTRKSSAPSSQPHPHPSNEEDKSKRVSSPPPPSSSPPPPLTPPPSSSPPPPLTPPTSDSQETTPTKYPFPETSPEVTPTKQPTTGEIPNIFVTPPTRHVSVSSVNQDFGSMDCKLVRKEMSSFATRGKRSDSGFQEPPDLATPSESSATDGASDTSKAKPKQQSPPKRPQNEAVRTPPVAQEEPVAGDGGKKEAQMTEDELKETLSGFEVPPPGRDAGFEIGDDQTLEAKFPPKMEVMKKNDEKKTTTATGARPRWGGGSLLMKNEAVSKTTQSSSTGKPRKWGSQTPRPVPEPENRSGTHERLEKVQKVGKLVMPSIFGSGGGGGGTTPSSSPTASPRSKPAIPESQPVKPVSEPVKPVSAQEQPAKLDTTTPPVLRMIRRIEAEKKQSSTPQPSPPAITNPLPAEQNKPVLLEPVKPVLPEPAKPVKQDSQPPPGATSVKALLARFEKTT